ncbi:hypothetical protein FHR22_002509 [Sphingopyxis panaciterrae]|uniref:ATP synthase F0 subunit B n=1 Tax=Sphingopyxis panaciterrae TaxID=363841 RepID=UPI00142395CE|nr:ATP synthase F0 subunit B [Sphingopyxis panaciterrae]NIJ37806.1 hypothetical protein [Sphingopyxis panaciterrae]
MRKCAVTAAGVAAMLATPAMADERWLVYTGGEKPNRIFVVVDETYLDAVPFAEKTYKLETITVLESAKAPDWVSSNMIIDCDRNTLEEKLIQVSPRGGKLTTAPDQPAKQPTNAVGEALIAFACEMGPKNSEQRLAARKTDLTGRGWMYMGPVTTSDVTDLAWNSMWTDGKRPAGTPRSAAELEREMASLDARRQKALAEAQAIAGQVVETDKKDQQRTADIMAQTEANGAIAKARKRREPAAVLRGIEPWILHGEAELVASWGPPTNFEDRGGKRFLHYYKTGVMLGPDPSQGCGPGNMYVPDPNSKSGGMMCVGGAPARSETPIECTASFELRDGTIIDYVTKGT